uniref:6-cysteine protein n=1 Tax=Strongyloides venezuelensis TaxID=75913 RepID=A0A0K0FI47_STRVS
MLVRFLLISLIIFKDTTHVSSYNNPEHGTIRLFGTEFSGHFNTHKELITINFNSLEKYETEEKRYLNVKFKEIGIVHIPWDNFKHDSSGFALRYDFSRQIYDISYAVGYYEGNNFDYLKLHYVLCNIRQCDLGLMFFVKKQDAWDLNNVNEERMIENTVLLIIKSSDNMMLLSTRPYHKVNIRIGLCPYINWVPKRGILKFKPEDHLKDNGFFEEENGYAHIVVPFYKKNYDAKEFICGKLKQPTMPDLLIGFTLKEDDKNIEISGVVDPLKEEIKCESSDDPRHHYHFGYSETDTNYMTERIMDVMEIRNKDSNYKFYAGQKIYIYKWENIAGELINHNKIIRLTNNPGVEELPCIKTLKSDIHANILPTIGSVDSIQKHQKKNIFYRLLKLNDLNKIHTFRCLSKVEGMNKAHMDEFYSRSAVFSIKNEEKPNVIYTLTKNEIIFDRENIENYGSYRCKESKVTRVFNKNITTMDKVYYLPDENSELPLEELKNNNKQYIGCVKQYESLGEIKKIRIEFGENVREPIDIDNFSNGTDKIDIKENFILYKTPKDVFGVIVKCIYKTPVDTTFYTKREIHFHIIGGTEAKNDKRLNEMKKNTVTKGGCNTTAWIIGIVATVVLFCIIMIILINVLVRKAEKGKIGNSSSMSLSSSKSSNRSKNNSNVSSGMGGSRNTTAGRRRSPYKSTILKISKNGKGSKSSTSSRGVTRNSTSSNVSKSYAKNFKLVAK